MDKKTAGIILGKPKVSEFSTEGISSENNNPIILKIYAKDVDIDFDLDNNVFIKDVNNLITRGKNLKQEFEQSDENISKDKSIKCLRYFLEALETISIGSKQILMSSELLKITASENIKILSKNIELGSLEDTEGLNLDDEENLKYDYILTNRKFNRWWKNVLNPFMNKITEFMTKYDIHTHSGTVPPPLGEDAIRDFKPINEKAGTSEKLIPSKTTKTI